MRSSAEGNDTACAGPSVSPTGGNCAGLQQLFSKTNVPPLLIGMSLMLFQQITGQPSVLYYASRIFKDAGFASDEEATRVSIYLGLFKLIATGVDCRRRLRVFASMPPAVSYTCQCHTHVSVTRVCPQE